MASNIPSQVRTVDPFASYNSNTVNKLTRMITFNDDVLMEPNSLRLSHTSDATSVGSVIVVSAGQVYKDDTLVEVTTDISVDFNDENFYYDWDQPTLGFNETGYYYIVLRYRYVKSRPAPQASIQILKPSQRGSFTLGGDWVFLGAVYATNTAPPVLTDIYDYDPSNPTVERRYAKEYAGSFTTLPTHISTEHRGQIAYEVTTDQFYVGFQDRWEPFPQNFINIDTTAASVGDLCYVDSNGEAALAVATALTTGAEIAVVEFGLEVTGTGQAVMSGLVSSVNVESTSLDVSVGDLLYLSSTEAGKVTSTQTSPYSQVVGRALSDEASSKVDILFFPRDVLETGTASRLTDTLSGADWVLDGTSYVATVDISSLNITGQDVVVSCRDASDDDVIIPEKINLSVADTVRVRMPVNTITLVVTVVG